MDEHLAVDKVKTKKTPTSQWCSGIGCKNSRYKNQGLAFFRFPRDQPRCRRWVINSRRDDLISKSAKELYKSNVLCAVHFEDSQFTNSKMKNRLRPLKAVPTLFDVPNAPALLEGKRPPPKELRPNEPKTNTCPTTEQQQPASPQPLPSTSATTCIDINKVKILKKKIDTQRKTIKRLRSKAKGPPVVSEEAKREVEYLKSTSAKYLKAEVHRFFSTQLDMSIRKGKRWSAEDKSHAILNQAEEISSNLRRTCKKKMSKRKDEPKSDQVIIDVLIKFGGSAITEKRKLETLKPEQLRIASQHIKQCRDSGITCVIVHGAGSFGHHHAKRFGVNQGLCEITIEEEKRSRMKGFCLTRQSVTKLNKMVVDSLIEHEVPAVSCSPGIGWKTKRRQPVKWPREELDELLRNGLIPVFHGDCCLDEELGCCILSGDTIVKSICSHFLVKRVVFLTDVAGVYSKPPDDPGAQLLKAISVNEDGTTQTSITSSCIHHDVTGGIQLKLQTAFDIVSTTASTVYVCAVHSHEALLVTLGQKLEDESLQLTKITCLK